MSIMNAPAFASYAASNDLDMSNNFAQDALSVAVGSVVDFGVSIHNSVNWAWGGDDASTYDVLNTMGMNNMASGYMEHKGLINTISFVGGMFVPGMAGIKLSRAARAGLAGSTLLAPAHMPKSYAKLAKLVTEGKKNTLAFRQLQNKTMYTGLAQGAVDNAAAEVAIVAAMNAHPFMEDYMDDFGENFATSLLIGSGIGAAVDAASTWYGVKKAVGGAESVAQQAVINELPSRSLMTDGIINFQESQTAIKQMDNLIQNPEVSELTRQIAVRTRQTLVSEADSQLQRGLSGKLADDLKSSDEIAEHLRNVFSNEQMIGVGKAEYLKVKPLAPSKAGAIRRWAGSLINKVTDPKSGAESFNVRAAYSPREGFIVHPEDAQMLAGAADVSDPSQIRAMSRGVSPYKIDDVAIDMEVELPAFIEVRQLAALEGYDKLPLAKQYAIHESDLPSKQGLLMSAMKKKAELSTIQADLAALREAVPQLTGEALADTNKAIKKLIKQEEELARILDTPVKIISDADSLFNTQVLTKGAQKRLNIKPTHLQDLHKETQRAKPMASWDGVGGQARDAINTWIKGGGGERTIRKAVAEYRRNPSSAPSWIKEIMENPERQRQLAELRKHADADGNIYLRRGTRQRTNGHHEVESFTTDAKISASFASNTGHDYAYKVNVDDVVGYIRGLGESEWIVMSPTREFAKDTSKFSRIITNEADNTLATAIPTVKLSDFKQHVDAATTDYVVKMATLGKSPEEIARRANVEIDSVHSILGSHGEAKGIQYHYTDANKIDEYLSPKQRMISLSDNGRLGTYKEYAYKMQAGADQAALDKWNTETTISLMQTSQSSTAKNFMDEMGLATTNSRGRNEFFNMHDTLKASLGKITDGLAGNRFIQSADMYSRMMDDAGYIVNQIGERSARVANKANDALIGPANQYLSAIARSEPELVAHNVFVQAYRSSGKPIRLTDNFEFMEIHGVKKLADGTAVEDLRPLTYLGKEVAIPDTMPNVRALFRQYENIGKELQQMRVTHAKVTGAALPSDKGLWLPNYDPRSKFTGFVRTTRIDEQGVASIENRIVTGNTVEELNEKRAIIQRNADQAGAQIEFIWPKERNLRQSVEYDRLKDEALRGRLQVADLGQTKMGFAAEEVPKATLEEPRNLLHGYSASIYAHTRDMQGLLMSDIVDKLDTLRNFSTLAADDQAMTPLAKFLKTEVPAASVMKSTLLGSRDLMDNYVPARVLNDAFSNAVDTAISKINKLTDTITKSSGTKARIVDKWAEVDTQLEAAGIPNPFKGLDAMYIERNFATEVSSGDARRLVSVGNAFASTMALRFMEIAHPLVNMLSMPILTQSAMGSSAASIMGRHADDAAGLGMTAVARHMGNGVRYMNNPPPAMIPLYRRAESNGIFKPIVSEATDVIKLTRLREKGAIATAERLVEKIDGTLGGKLVAASDWSETLSRKSAFGSGVSIAMERYGLKLGIDDDKIFLFARDFVDRSIGNYAAHQRPVMFHGTLGAAVGLFQTYMVTFAQNIYRNLETRDFATIARTMGWQGSIFGLSALPGYDLMSKFIGEHYTNDHTDLTSGTYKNLPDGLANMLVYGLPSNVGALWGDAGIGPNFSTRGAVDPRVGVPAAQMLWDSASAISNVGTRMGLAGDVDAGRGMLEALSVQSISRPIARISELFLDYSITSQGRTVSTPEEVWTPIGIGSRIIGTRTTEEWRTRSALHLNTYYGSIDRKNRQSALEDIRTMIRGGDFNEGTLTKAFDRYLENGGTAQGFRAALNNAVEFESQSMDYRLLEDIKPDSPILHMIDTM